MSYATDVRKMVAKYAREALEVPLPETDNGLTPELVRRVIELHRSQIKVLLYALELKDDTEPQ